MEFLRSHIDEPSERCEFFVALSAHATGFVEGDVARVASTVVADVEAHRSVRLGNRSWALSGDRRCQAALDALRVERDASYLSQSFLIGPSSAVLVLRATD